MPEQTNHLLDAALGYARRGWRVFPCHTPTGNPEKPCSCNRADCDRPGKHPRTQGGVHAATIDAGAIARWWQGWPTANVAVAAGALSGLVILDVDGAAGFTAIKNAGYEIPDTLSVVTSADDKKHFYFKHPGVDMRNFVGKLDKVDMRAENGYVIAPPSLHVAGRRYKWIDEDMAVEVCPQWLIDIGKRETGGAPTEASRLAKPLTAEPITEGLRDNTIFRIACRFRSKGLEEDQILLLIENENRARCQPPLLYEELQRIAKQAAKYKPADALDVPDAPNWMLGISALKAAGVSDKVIEAASKEASIKTESEKTNKLDVQLVRCTFGPGRGGRFDMTIIYDNNVAALANITGPQAEDYQFVRDRMLGEGVVMPDGKESAANWKMLIDRLIASKETPVVERMPEDDVVQSIAAFAADWILTRHRVSLIDELHDAPSTNVLEIPGEMVAFSLSDLTRAVRREIPDARRNDVAQAWRLLDVKTYTPNKGASRRRLRKASIKTLEKVT